jgi:hypothetical protein
LVTPSGAGGRMLDEIVVELLTPVLATWLEQNLPRLVSEQVQAQARRAVRRKINTLDTSFAATVVRLITRGWGASGNDRSRRRKPRRRPNRA